MQNLSRREFLKTGALATGVLATTTLSANNQIKSIKWDKEFDVIVVGSGLSEHISAIGTAEAGLKTIIIEKMSTVGGNSRISGQDFAVLNSDIQKNNGIKDNADDFIADMVRAGKGYHDIDHTKRIVHNTARAYEFARDRGVKYDTKPLDLVLVSQQRT